MNYIVVTTDGEKGKAEDITKIDVVDDLVYFMSQDATAELATVKLIVNKPVLKFIKPEGEESNERG